MTRWWRHRRHEGERTAEVTFNALEGGPASPTLRERTVQGVRQAMVAFRRIASAEIGAPGTGSGGIGGGIGDEDWEPRYEFTATKLQEFPLPGVLPRERARESDLMNEVAMILLCWRLLRRLVCFFH